MGKIDKGGLPVVQGHKDCTLGMWRDAGKRKRKNLREVAKVRDLGSARRLVT